MGRVVRIVQPGDVDGLTRALDEALRNSRDWRRQHGEGLDRFKVFREEQVVQQYLRVYQSVIHQAKLSYRCGDRGWRSLYHFAVGYQRENTAEEKECGL